MLPAPHKSVLLLVLTINEPLLFPTDTAAAKKFGRVCTALPTTATARPEEMRP
jgi:hypothetical protein